MGLNSSKEVLVDFINYSLLLMNLIFRTHCFYWKNVDIATLIDVQLEA